jgi:hypothetical protein
MDRDGKASLAQSMGHSVNSGDPLQAFKITSLKWSVSDDQLCWVSEADVLGYCFYDTVVGNKAI